MLVRAHAHAHACARTRIRFEPVGSDRHGSLYWILDSAVWVCNEDWFPPTAANASDSAGSGGCGSSSSKMCVWRCYMKGASMQRLVEFLRPQGPRERQLLSHLQRYDWCPAITTAPGTV